MSLNLMYNEIMIQLESFIELKIEILKIYSCSIWEINNLPLNMVVLNVPIGV